MPPGKLDDVGVAETFPAKIGAARNAYELTTLEAVSDPHLRVTYY